MNEDLFYKIYKIMNEGVHHYAQPRPGSQWKMKLNFQFQF